MRQPPGVWSPVTSWASGLGVLCWLKSPQGLEEGGLRNGAVLQTGAGGRKGQRVSDSSAHRWSYRRTAGNGSGQLPEVGYCDPARSLLQTQDHTQDPTLSLLRTQDKGKQDPAKISPFCQLLGIFPDHWDEKLYIIPNT